MPLECVKCNQKIKHVAVEAMGKTWHQEHFVCTHCQEPIQSKRYHLENNMPYCPGCYESHYLKTCSRCGDLIRGVVVMALDKPYHPEHFNCVGCGAVLTNKGFYEHDGRPFCQNCFGKDICYPCTTCGKPILDSPVVVQGERYHANCFQCSRCHKPLKDGGYMVAHDRVLCVDCDS